MTTPTWNGSTYIVQVPYLEDLAVGREDQALFLLEGEGVDGSSIVVVLHQVGPWGTEVIQQYLEGGEASWTVHH